MLTVEAVKFVNKQWEKCYKAFSLTPLCKENKNSLSAELDVVVRMSESATASPCAAQANRTQAQEQRKRTRKEEV